MGDSDSAWKEEIVGSVKSKSVREGAKVGCGRARYGSSGWHGRAREDVEGSVKVPEGAGGIKHSQSDEIILRVMKSFSE